MNMSAENKERVFKILKLLEYNGWVIYAVNDGGDSIEIDGDSPKARCEAAFEVVDSVDYSEVYIRHSTRLTSFVNLIISNDEDMLSDHGSLLIPLFEEFHLSEEDCDDFLN